MCNHCDFENVKGRIEDLLESGEVNFAQETLENIYSWIEENDHVTPKQRQAVENIARSKGL